MRVIVTLAAVAVACGCTSSADQEPRRPAISRPLDASAYVGRVCDLLPADQATRLGYSAAGDEVEGTPSAAGQPPPYYTCSRIPPESPILSIYLHLTGDRLAYEYSASKNVFVGGTQEPWLEALTIAGQPAATLGRSHKMPNKSCEVVVGLTDTQSLRVSARQHYRDPRGYDDGHGDGRACEHAIAVAEVAVKTLGG